MHQEAAVNIIYSSDHLLHDPQFEINDGLPVDHAEKVERAETIMASLKVEGVGRKVPPRRFPLRHTYAIHDKAYVDFVRTRSDQLALGEVLYPSFYITDTYAPVTSGSYLASRSAVDCALTGASMILGNQRTVYSLCRPPGHHAAHSSMGGYCYFNNAAIASNYLSAHGKVAVLDIDYHHGNGTQEVFYDRNDVLYVSLHADPDTNYPYISGRVGERGSGAGFGYTYNYPLSKNTGNGIYLRVLQDALEVIKKFSPDYLVISAGFDTFNLDPIGGLRLTESVYAQCGQLIAGLELPTLIIQEGGYNLEHLGGLVVGFLRAFDL